MTTRDEQVRIDRRIAYSMKRDDEWQSINYPELTAEENTDIRVARRLGLAVMYPAYPNAEAQSRNTLKAARAYLKANL
jgi:hypothetical protein